MAYPPDPVNVVIPPPEPPQGTTQDNTWLHTGETGSAFIASLATFALYLTGGVWYALVMLVVYLLIFLANQIYVLGHKHGSRDGN